MAFKLPEIFTRSDAKSRVVIVLGAVLGLVGLIFLASKYLSGPNAGAGKAKLANAPSGLQSVPGGQLSPEYYRALMQANTQASKQAQITGSSAVPTLINASGQEGPQPQGDCTVMCPGEEAANVADDVNNLLKLGKLSKEDAGNLLDLAKNNASDTDYENALNNLVKQGKLTPDQARKLLADYKKQHANNRIDDSAKFMDSLIQSGKVPLNVANDLLALQKGNVSTSDYAAELNRLVQEGKISPATAAQLLAQYTQQHAKTANEESAGQLRQMVQAGQISQDASDSLLKMQKNSVPFDQYKAELDRLVAAGKMTPATAAKLSADYQKQRTAIAPATTLNTLLASNPNPALSAEGKKLLQMQANNASVNDYAAELKKAVQEGLISPDMAARMLQEYQALMSPSTITAETNVPGNDALGKLQQRLREQQAQTELAGVGVSPGETSKQFAQAQAQNQAQAEAEAQRLRQQRIQDLMSGMSAQMHSLVSAWQPPAMEHKEGSLEKKTTTTTTTTTQGTSTEGTTGNASGSAGKSSAPPIIKAGTIMFAILDTAVDSDYPDTPVMATIVSGEYKGAKVLGKLALATGQDKVSLTFNLLDKDGWPTTKSVTAFAIDPDTARTVMASDVNYHYMLRYGSMFASSFVTGYASAISNAGATTSSGIFGTTTTHPQLSPASKIAVGLGQVGTTMGNAMSSYFNTPTTVKVDAGVSLGILFMADVPA